MAKQRRQQSDFEDYQRSRSDEAFYTRMNQVGMDDPVGPVQSEGPNINQSKVDYGSTVFGQGSRSQIGGNNSTRDLANILSASVDLAGATVKGYAAYAESEDNETKDLLNKAINDVEKNESLSPEDKAAAKKGVYKEYKNKFWLRKNKNATKQLKREAGRSYDPLKYEGEETRFKNEVKAIKENPDLTPEEKTSELEKVREKYIPLFGYFKGNAVLEPKADALMTSLDNSIRGYGVAEENERIVDAQAQLTQVKNKYTVLENEQGELTDEDLKRKEAEINAVLSSLEDVEDPNPSQIRQIEALRSGASVQTSSDSAEKRSRDIAEVRGEYQDEMLAIMESLGEGPERMEAISQAVEDLEEDLKALDLPEAVLNKVLREVVGGAKRNQLTEERKYAKELIESLGVKIKDHLTGFIDELISDPSTNMSIDYENDAAIFAEFEDYLASKGIPLYDEEGNVEESFSGAVRDLFGDDLKKSMKLASDAVRNQVFRSMHDRSMLDLKTNFDGVTDRLSSATNGIIDVVDHLGDFSQAVKDAEMTGANSDSSASAQMKFGSYAIELAQSITLRDINPNNLSLPDLYTQNLDLLLDSLEEAGVSESTVSVIKDYATKNVNLIEPKSVRDRRFLLNVDNPFQTDSTSGQSTFNTGVMQTQLDRYYALSGEDRKIFGPELVEVLQETLAVAIEHDLIRGAFSLDDLELPDRGVHWNNKYRTRVEALLVETLFENRTTGEPIADSLERFREGLQEGDLELDPVNAEKVVKQARKVLTSPLVGPIIDLRNEVERSYTTGEAVDGNKSRESLEKIEARFAKDGLLQGGRGNVYLLNPPLSPEEQATLLINDTNAFNNDAGEFFRVNEAHSVLDNPGSAEEIGAGIDILTDNLFNVGNTNSFISLLEASSLGQTKKTDRINTILEEAGFDGAVISEEQRKILASRIATQAENPESMEQIRTILREEFVRGFTKTSFSTAFSAIGNDTLKKLPKEEQKLDRKLVAETISIDTLQGVLKDSEMATSIILELYDSGINTPSSLDIVDIIKKRGFKLGLVQDPLNSNNDILQIVPDPEIDYTSDANLYAFGQNAAGDVDIAVDQTYYSKDKMFVELVDSLRSDVDNPATIAAFETLLDLPNRPELQDLPNMLEVYRQGFITRDVLDKHIKESFLAVDLTEGPEGYLESFTEMAIFALDDGRLSANSLAVLDHYLREGRDFPEGRTANAVKLSPRFRGEGIGFDLMDTVNQKRQRTTFGFNYTGQPNSANPAFPFELNLRRAKTRLEVDAQKNIDAIDQRRELQNILDIFLGF